MAVIAPVHYPRGVMLELHPSPDYLSDHIRTTGDFYEADILDELAQRVTGGVIVDAGAMIGNHTAYLAAFVPYTAIHAFEPLLDNLELLKRNTAGFPRIVIHPYALSHAHTSLALRSVPGNHGHTVEAGERVIPAIPLDALELIDVSLLKVDVEGHETQVLAGARQTIARCRPLVLVEDWDRRLGSVMDSLGYRLAVAWADSQTYLYEPIDCDPAHIVDSP